VGFLPLLGSDRKKSFTLSVFRASEYMEEVVFDPLEVLNPRTRPGNHALRNSEVCALHVGLQRLGRGVQVGE